MPNITLSVPSELKEEMEKFREVSWSTVCRNSIILYIEARKSSNPVARAKFIELKQKEIGEGFKFGIKISEWITNELTYSEIFRMLAQVDYYEAGRYEDDHIGSWIYREIPNAYNSEFPKFFEEQSKKKGCVEWLLTNAQQYDDFNRNPRFIEGLFKALKEIFR